MTDPIDQPGRIHDTSLASDVHKLRLRIVRVEESLEHLPAIRTGINDMQVRFQELARKDDEHRDSIQQLAVHHSRGLQTFQDALETQRVHFQAALESQRRQHTDALDNQEQRWRKAQENSEERWRNAQEATEARWQASHEKVMNETIASFQNVVARTVMGKVGQWVIAGILSLIALLGSLFWTRLTK